jgi:DNA-directed RNA polymerase specialized sigma24 family protein
MAAPSGRGSCWWDRDVDATGRIIRADVREAGHQLWQQALRRVRLICGDEADAGWLMESAVEGISRYLDRKGSPVFSKDIRWLLLSAFCRLLGRQKRKLERLELVGNLCNVAERKAESDWVSRANGRADLTRILRGLSPESCTILALRVAGLGWREIAGILHTTEAAARRRFWREIGRVRRTLRENPKPE